MTVVIIACAHTGHNLQYIRMADTCKYAMIAKSSNQYPFFFIFQMLQQLQFSIYRFKIVFAGNNENKISHQNKNCTNYLAF